MSKSINIIYSKPQLGFFSEVKRLRGEVHKFMEDPNIMIFNEKDEIEIGRGDGYALFDGLKTLYSRGEVISFDAFRASLEKLGVTDRNFQNKVICMILQTKLGIQINVSNALMNIICDSLCKDKQYSLYPSEKKIFLDIEKNDRVLLSIDAVLKNNDLDNLDNLDNNEPLISLHIRFSISPEMVSITEFSFIKLSNNPNVDDFYNTLKEHQHSILIRIILWIKRFFGFNAELRLEESVKQQLVI